MESQARSARVSIPKLILIGVLYFSSLFPFSVCAQLPPSGERYMLMLSSDPFKWEHALNEIGEKGWDGIMALQPSTNGLTLHLVVFVRTPNVKVVSYRVIVAEFPKRSEPAMIEATRLQLEIQGNSFSQNGWQMVQPLTGAHGADHAFMALIFKKPQQ